MNDILMNNLRLYRQIRQVESILTIECHTRNERVEDSMFGGCNQVELQALTGLD